MKFFIVVAITLIAAMPLNAGVQDWATNAHVNYIEMKVGDSFRFKVDAQTGPCSPNSWLVFDARFYDPTLRSQMVKEVYAVVLAAKLSGQGLQLLGDNTPESGNCVVGIVNAD